MSVLHPAQTGMSVLRKLSIMALDNINELDVKNASPFPTALRYGVIGGLLVIVIGLIQYLLGITSTISQAVGWLSMLITIVFPVLAIRGHRDNDLGGYISYGRGLGTGVLTALIIGLVTAIWTILLYNVIDPSIMDQIMQVQAEAMEEQGMSDEDIENVATMTGKFMTAPVMAAIGFGTSLLFGFVASLIAGAVMKRERTIA